MISRIRLEAFGATAAAVEQALNTAAHKIDAALRLNAALDGEMVIERDLPEPYGSRHTYKGRLVLHPDVQENATQWAEITGTGTTSTGTGTDHHPQN